MTKRFKFEAEKSGFLIGMPGHSGSHLPNIYRHQFFALSFAKSGTEAIFERVDKTHSEFDQLAIFAYYLDSLLGSTV